MKVYVKNIGTCQLNYQHECLEEEINKYGTLTDDVSKADAIVFTGTCACTEMQIVGTINDMSEILKKANKSAKVYMTGCLTRKITKEHKFFDIVNKWIELNIDEVIPQNEPVLLLEKIFDFKFDVDYRDDFGGLVIDNNFARIYISNGCLHKCLFCKTTFQDYPLRSAKFDDIITEIDFCNKSGISDIWLCGTNVSQYGFDNYGEYLLPELLSYIESRENIKSVSLVGFGFADAIKNGFGTIMRECSKVDILSGSLESGSDRILKLMRKGFTSRELIDFVNYVRELYSKRLYLSIIAGFPTETMDDVRMTLEILKQLEPAYVDICRYTDSSFVDSHKLEQLEPRVIKKRARIYDRGLKRCGIDAKVGGFDYVYNNKLKNFE